MNLTRAAAEGPRATCRWLRTRPAPPLAPRPLRSGSANPGRRRGARAAANGRGLTSLRVGQPTSGAQPVVGVVLGGPRSGGISHGWVQRRSRLRGPSQTSASEFPPCASAASNVRVRPLFSGLVDLTFRGLWRGNSLFLPDLSRAGSEPNL